MKLDTFLLDLRAPEPVLRARAARILGMLDEVDALDALTTQFKAETHPAVKAAIAWAGKRLQAAKHGGYTTLEAIIHYFHIDYEIETLRTDNADEAHILRQMQTRMDSDLIRQQGERLGSFAKGVAVNVALFGMQGAITSAMTVSPMADVLSSTLGEERLGIGKTRTPATRPSNTDIKALVRRMQSDPDAERRAKAALDLAVLANNPEALPYLAQTHLEDPVPQVQEAALRAAKLIYWNSVYWEMEQDGRLAAEIQRRAGKAPPEPAEAVPAQNPALPAPEMIEPEPPRPVGPVKIANVLRKVEQVRHKRQQDD
jgi:HEAT repeat protein